MIAGILQKQILGSEQNNGKNITRLTKMLETCLDHPRAQSYTCLNVPRWKNQDFDS